MKRGFASLWLVQDIPSGACRLLLSAGLHADREISIEGKAKRRGCRCLIFRVGWISILDRPIEVSYSEYLSPITKSFFVMPEEIT